MSKLPKPHYTLVEAARIIAQELGEEVSVKELLQWAGEQQIFLQAYLSNVQAYTSTTGLDGSEIRHRVTRSIEGQLNHADVSKEDALVDGFFSLKLTPELSHELQVRGSLEYRHFRFLNDKWVCDVDIPYNSRLRGEHPPRAQNLLVPHNQLVRLQEALTSILPTRNELDTKSRKTYLRVIAGLCKLANINWTERGQAQVIVRAVEQVGERVTDDTVRSILKQIIDDLDAAP